MSPYGLKHLGNHPFPFEEPQEPENSPPNKMPTHGTDVWQDEGAVGTHTKHMDGWMELDSPPLLPQHQATNPPGFPVT